MSILHGTLYKHLKDIRTDGVKSSYEARIPVLMFLISTANMRLRTWHGTKAIMEYTGFSKTPVVDAINWLESRGAIYNVPKSARSGLESRVHANRKVWQLTGIMQIGQTIIDYLYIKDEDRQSVLLEVEDHAPDHVKDLFVSLNLIEKESKIGLQNEPISKKIEHVKQEIGLQDKPKKQEIGLQNEPKFQKIGLQDSTAKELSKRKNLVNKKELSKKDSTLCVDAELNSNIQNELKRIHGLLPAGNVPIDCMSKESEIVIEAKKLLEKTKFQKSRNRLYDMVALICFDLNAEALDKASKKTKTRIGMVKAALMAIDDEPDADQLADELCQFKKRYKAKFPDAAIPRDPDKATSHFLSLRKIPTIKPAFDYEAAKPPASEDDMEPWDWDEFYAEIENAK